MSMQHISKNGYALRWKELQTIVDINILADINSCLATNIILHLLSASSWTETV